MNGQIYRISVARSLMLEVFATDKLTNIQGKVIRIRTDDQGQDIVLTRLNQIEIINQEQNITSSSRELLTGTIASITNGDTIVLKENQQVLRLACLDAPDLGQNPWGVRATDYLTDVLPIGSLVNYEVVDQTNYGHSVAEVYKDERLINELLISSGNAVVYYEFLDNCTENKDIYIRAEESAKSNRLQFWGQTNVCLPWNFRRNQCS